MGELGIHVNPSSRTVSYFKGWDDQGTPLFLERRLLHRMKRLAMNTPQVNMIQSLGGGLSSKGNKAQKAPGKTLGGPEDYPHSKEIL